MSKKGRINQKKRTREALLQAAHRLMMEGNTQFSIEEVAKEALVSTATAYRYFSNPETLRIEAPLQLQTKVPDKVFEHIPSDDLDERVETLLKYHEMLYLDNELKFRLFLNSTLLESFNTPEKQLRGGRRIILIKEAFESLKDKISKENFERLTHTLSIFFGIESVIVLKDVCRLPNEEIIKVWRWATAKILDSILSEEG